MSAIVVGAWELGWNTPIKEIDLWEMVVRDFEVSDFYMCPVSGICSDAVKERSDMGELLQEFRDNNKTIVFIDEAGKEELSDFIHPDDAVYVFGIVTQSTYKIYNKPGDKSVVIKTNARKALLWPHQCAALVLYDRMNKCQQ